MAITNICEIFCGAQNIPLKISQNKPKKTYGSYMHITCVLFFPSIYFSKQPRRLSSEPRAVPSFSPGPVQGEFNLRHPYHLISNDHLSPFDLDLVTTIFTQSFARDEVGWSDALQVDQSFSKL